jgi:hypothetical protein
MDHITLLSRTDHLAAFDVRLPSGGGPRILHRHAACELYRIHRGRGAEMASFAAAARDVADTARVLDIASDHGIEITRPLTELA